MENGCVVVMVSLTTLRYANHQVLHIASCDVIILCQFSTDHNKYNNYETSVSITLPTYKCNIVNSYKQSVTVSGIIILRW